MTAEGWVLRFFSAQGAILRFICLHHRKIFISVSTLFQHFRMTEAFSSKILRKFLLGRTSKFGSNYQIWQAKSKWRLQTLTGKCVLWIDGLSCGFFDSFQKHDLGFPKYPYIRKSVQMTTHGEPLKNGTRGLVQISKRFWLGFWLGFWVKLKAVDSKSWFT